MTRIFWHGWRMNGTSCMIRSLFSLPYCSLYWSKSILAIRHVHGTDLFGSTKPVHFRSGLAHLSILISSSDWSGQLLFWPSWPIYVLELQASVYFANFALVAFQLTFSKVSSSSVPDLTIMERNVSIYQWSVAAS